MQLKPTVETLHGVSGHPQSIGSGFSAHALLKEFN